MTPSEQQEFQKATHFTLVERSLVLIWFKSTAILLVKVRGGGGGGPHRVQFEVSIHESKFRSFFIISEATTPTSLCNSRVRVEEQGHQLHSKQYGKVHFLFAWPLAFIGLDSIYECRKARKACVKSGKGGRW